LQAFTVLIFKLNVYIFIKGLIEWGNNKNELLFVLLLQYLYVVINSDIMNCQDIKFPLSQSSQGICTIWKLYFKLYIKTLFILYYNNLSKYYFIPIIIFSHYQLKIIIHRVKYILIISIVYRSAFLWLQLECADSYLCQS